MVSPEIHETKNGLDYHQTLEYFLLITANF